MSIPNEYKRSYLNLWDESKTQRFRVSQTETETAMLLNSNTFALVDGVRSVTETVSELLRIEPIHSQILSVESRTTIQETGIVSLSTRASIYEVSTNSQASLVIRALESIASLSTRAGLYESNTGSEASKISQALDSMTSLSDRAGLYESNINSEASKVIRALDSITSLSTRASNYEVSVASEGSKVLRALDSIISLSTRASNYEVSVASEGSKVIRALDSMTSLSTRVSVLESSTGSLGVRTSTVINSITSLSTRSGVYESNIVSLGTRMMPIIPQHPPFAMTNNNSGGYIASASTEANATANATFNAFNAFDYNVSTNFGSKPNYVAGAYPNDGSSVTIINSPSSTYYGEWIQLQLQVPIVLYQFHMTPQYDTINNLPKNFVILGSNDGSTWTRIQSYSNSTYSIWPNKTFFSITSPSTAYSYYRMAVNALVGSLSTNTGLRIAEWRLYESNSIGQLDSLASRASLLDASISNQDSRLSQLLTETTYPLVALTANDSNGYIASASSESNSSLLAFNAFNLLDNDYAAVANNAWVCASYLYNSTTGAYIGSKSTNVDGVSQVGEWLQIQLPISIVLKSFILTPRRDTSTFNKQSPVNFIIAASNNGSTWTSVYSSTNTVWTIEYPRVFTIPSPSATAYKYYRLITSSVGSSDTVIITEWRLTADIALIPSLTTRASIYETGVSSQGSLAIRALNSITSLSARAGNLETNVASQGSLTIRALDSISSLGNRASIYETGVASQGSLIIRAQNSIASLSSRVGIYESDIASVGSRMTILSPVFYPNISMSANSFNGYIASSSSFNGSQVAFKVFDNDLTTSWKDGNGSYGLNDAIYSGSISTTYNNSIIYYGEWIQIQLPMAIILRRFHIIPTTSSQEFAPGNFVILGSNNGSSWSLIQSYVATSYNSSISPQQKTFFTVNSPSGNYNYYRMAVNKIFGSKQVMNLSFCEWGLYDSVEGQLDSLSSRASLLDDSISELGSRTEHLIANTLYPLIGLTSNNSNGYVASASTQFTSDYEAWRAFDGLYEDYEFFSGRFWLSDIIYSLSDGSYLGSVSTNVNGMAVSGEWLQIQLPSPIVLKSFVLTPRRDFNLYTTSPKDFIIVGSNNGSNWSSVYSSVNTIWTNEYPRVFNIISPSGSYLYYRLIITNNNGNSVAISEWRLESMVPLMGSLTSRAELYENNIASEGSKIEVANNRISSLTTRFSNIETSNYGEASKMTIVETDLSLARDAILAIFDNNPMDANYSTLQLITTTINVNPEAFSVEQVYSRLDYITSVIDRLTDEQE